VERIRDICGDMQVGTCGIVGVMLVLMTGRDGPTGNSGEETMSKVTGLGGLTKQQTLWAASHDWFVRVEWNAQVEGLSVIVMSDGIGSDEIEFHNFAKLRAWAGY
jgi:hypothetical protein